MQNDQPVEDHAFHRVRDDSTDSFVDGPHLVWVDPSRQKIVFGTLGVMGVAALVAAILGASTANTCAAHPLALRFGESVVTEMAVLRGMSCTLQVKTGGAPIEDLIVESLPRAGRVFTRGRTGVIYQPSLGYFGEDSFEFTLLGRAAAGQPKMTIRVGVLVK